jgi:hypothetical protein
MGSEFLEHRPVEEVAIINAVLTVSEVTHSTVTVHQNSIRPKPDRYVDDALVKNANISFLSAT